jgi:hypothetical protein
MIVISTPSLLIPGDNPETTQVVTLLAVFGAAFTLSEYASTYPGLIEFRDAPPFNRIRALSIFVTLFVLSVLVSSSGHPTTLSIIIEATGLVLARALDFPYSPLNLLSHLIPAESPITDRIAVLSMGGLAIFIGLITLSVFAILVRVFDWPKGGTAFNVWVNLPTFDPTTGRDVVARLIRDARINILLGIILPFLLPVLASISADHLGLTILASRQTLVWTITLWTFFPVSLIMRGMAMNRVANMIEIRRKQMIAAVDADGMVPV